MRVRNQESRNDSELHFIATYTSEIEENRPSGSKYNTSFDRKIERLWLQSKTLGWSYNEFAVHLLEVLMILRHRDRVKLAAASKRIDA